MDAPRIARTRAFSVKVKTGCKSCKIRHIKCDETKPVCRRCRMSAVVCDGYDTKEDLSQDKSAVARVHNATGVSQALSLNPDLTANERRSLDYFRDQTRIDLSGYFDSLFWDRLVLQYGQSEIPVQYALVALSTTHEATATGSGTVVADDKSWSGLRQYNRAIRHLTRYMTEKGDSALEVTLICCVIFICIEGIRGNGKAAISHLQNGINILRHLQQGRPAFSVGYPKRLNKKRANEGRDRLLIRLFSQLDVQAPSMVRTNVPQLSVCEIADERNAEILFPTAFKSIGEAKSAFQNLTIALYYLLMRISGSAHNTSEEGLLTNRITHDYLKHQLQKYETALNTLLQDPSIYTTQRDRDAALLLRLHLNAASVTLGIEIAQNKTHEDLAKEQRTVVNLAKILIQRSKDQARYLRTTSAFSHSFDLGVIGPLYLIAMICHEPLVRQEAIELLYETKRGEGIWDGSLAAEIAQQEIKAEAMGLHKADIMRGGGPEAARVYGLASCIATELPQMVVIALNSV